VKYLVQWKREGRFKKYKGSSSRVWGKIEYRSKTAGKVEYGKRQRL